MVGGEGLTAVAAGRHACGLNPAGEALCWGLVLGVERTAPISGSTRFAALSAGLSYTCGLTSEGRALCWGNNESGQLGDGTTTNRTEPAPVSTPVVFKSISAGSRHTCAISVDDELICWGSDAFGQLAGRGSDLCAPQFFFDPYGCGRTPTLVASGTRFTSVAIGTRHTCAVTTSNRALCWGSNQSGELGVASSDSCTDPYRFASPPVVSCSRTPLIVPGVQEWSAIDASERHTCGLTVSGDAYCWGVLQGGETPKAPTVSYGRTPVAIPGPRFTALSTGFDQVCGITVSAALYCWGFNLSGQLGLGVATRERNPVSVIGLTL